jgi:tRNA(Ile)-lysidine synthase
MLENKFLDNFEQFTLNNKLISKGDKILVGFSGGADSTALLLALWHLRSRLNFSLLAAHINYNLRGKDSVADAEFVKEFCFSRNISIVIKDMELDQAGNLENNARNIRFDYFNQLAKLYKVNKIALGHNKGDQAETILFRLFRGSGFTGIKGITPMDGKLIHPLMGFSRNEITEFLINEDLGWREDLTNQENIFSRNIIRNELIPWIEKNLNPNVISKLYNTGTIFRETDEIMLDLARRRILKAKVKRDKTDFRFSLKVLRRTRPALRFYIYKEIYRQIAGTDKDFYHNNFEEIEAIIDSPGSKKINLPNKVYVFKEYDEIIFNNKAKLKIVDVNYKKEITSLRKRLVFEDRRIIFDKLKKMRHSRNLYEDRFTTYLDLDKIVFPIIIRHRQPGDRFYPLGMENPKKLKDFFIDEKVPKFDRDNVLIISDAEKILWIAGLRVDNRVAITEKTSNILKVRIEKMAVKKARAAERITKRR